MAPVFASIWAAANLFKVCQGFTAPAQQHGSKKAVNFSLKLPTLRFKEDDDTLVRTAPINLVTLLEPKGLSLIEEAVVELPEKKTESLRPITFEDDIERYLSIARPSYALENEHAIVDDETGEMVGFVCTGRVKMPVGHEGGGIPFAEACHHMGAAGSIAALLRNPQKECFYYPASQYHIDLHPHKGQAREMLAGIIGGDQFPEDTNDSIIFTRCTDFSRRTATCDILIESADVTWGGTSNFSIVPTHLFKKRPPPALPDSANEPHDESPYEDFSELGNIKSFSDITGEWLTMEATLPPRKSANCQGHFYGNPALAHSVMIFHNSDLLDKAISEFTGHDHPCKRVDFGQENGMKMLSWTCLPENLHFPDMYGLKLQSKVFLSKGELGKPGSTYSLECMVKQAETGTVCYKATGSCILEPVEFLKTEFRRAIAKKDFDLV